ncbi:transcriptional regulator [Paenibacillus sp. GCM10012306]|uniref:helix-turn-helix transcriptional regulator n=1 Tax=Paenibacillus sp. GCM10012306 TaxID=3317342 RepID=UPI00360B5B8F
MQNNIDVAGLLKSISVMIAALMGPSTEVVVHDMENAEIIHIENGHITERQVGDLEDSNTIALLSQSAEQNSTLIGYLSTAKSNKPLKSSTLFIKDQDGNLKYTLCVNQDISAYKSAMDLLTHLTSTVTYEVEEQPGGETIKQITTKLIMEEIFKAKPFSMDSKEAKLKIIQQLDDKGVFDVKDAVPKVCELLSISQATLYNYQRELRVRKEKESSRR